MLRYGFDNCFRKLEIQIIVQLQIAETNDHYNILIRKINAKNLKPQFLENDHFDRVFSDMADEYIQKVTIDQNETFVACFIMTLQ